MLDVKKIHDDFPQLDGDAYHYLDAAATSLTPQEVLDAEIDYYTTFRASVHRGIFKEAVRATELYEDTRRKVAGFINGKQDEVIFTSGATESSNMLVRMIEESLNMVHTRKNIVTTVMEHHAALLPLKQSATRCGLTLLTIPLAEGEERVELDYEKAEALITDDTGLVSLVLASNVTGEINDIERLVRHAKKHGAITIIDATAAAGHIEIDVRKFGCDALYFSGHKMFAPTGIGVLWVNEELLKRLSPSIFGGHMIARIADGTPEWADIPSRFEAGTKNISGVIGLGAAIDYIERIGVAPIHAYIEELVAYTITRLEEIPGVTLAVERDVKKNVGIVSFTCDFAHPHDVAEVLARDNVAVRPGHHCAIPLHGALGVESTVRASFHCYNTTADVDALVVALRKCRTIFSSD